jgi:hypothetical protein
MDPEYQAASRAYMRYHNMNPIFGISSKYVYMVFFLARSAMMFLLGLPDLTPLLTNQTIHFLFFCFFDHRKARAMDP